jgi:hypothetical protein
MADNLAEKQPKYGRKIPKLFFGREGESLEEKRERQLRYRTALDEQKVCGSRHISSPYFMNR